MSSIDYPTTAEKFTIRRVTDTDGDILADLYENSPDTGDLGFAPRFRIDPYVAYTSLYATNSVDGFLAEAPDGSPAGAGFVTRTEARIGGKVRPTGHLAGVAVHPDYRGQGLAKRLAVKRIKYVNKNHAEDCTVYASIQTGNEPSRAVADMWADGMPYEITVVPLPPRDDAPESDYTLRALRDAERDMVVNRVNEFYASAELFSPYTTADLATRLETSPLDEPVASYLVAVDRNELVAGALVIDVHKLMWTKLVELPPDLEDADELPPSIPKSRELRVTAVLDLWYMPGYEDAGEDLLAGVRARPDVGNRVIVPADPEGPIGDLVKRDDGAVQSDIAVRSPVEPVEDTFAAPII